MKQKAADAAVERLLNRLEGAADDLPPGVTAERSPDGLRLRGKGLMRRWFADAALRAFAIVAARRTK